MNSLDQPDSGSTLRLIVTSDTVNLASIREAVANSATSIGFPHAVVCQIVLAVDEAMGNVIKHGYEGTAGRPIEVTIEPVQGRASPGLQVTICDCGRQVDPQTIVGRELEDVRPGGLGTHIIRNIMDEVEYSLRQPRGMRLRMTKFLGAKDHGARGEDSLPEGFDSAQ